MVARPGRSALGCLFSLLIIVAVVYFGVNAGESYWRFYQFQDDMRQEVNFAKQRTNEQIIARLRASADSLGLPDDAKIISIRRSENGISVESSYDDRVEMPMYVKEIHYRAHAEGRL